MKHKAGWTTFWVIVLVLWVTTAIKVNAKEVFAHDGLIDAIALVESSGNPKAHNVGEDAIGLLQIRPGVVKDLQQAGHKYTLEDRWDPSKSREMFRLYIRLYAPKGASWADVARIWNGGPKGHLPQKNQERERKLRIYTRKVQLAMWGE